MNGRIISPNPITPLRPNISLVLMSCLPILASGSKVNPTEEDIRRESNFGYEWTELDPRRILPSCS